MVSGLLRLALLAVVAAATPAGAQPVDPTSVARIVEAGTQHSQVMEVARTLTDTVGPRLTNSPGARRAEAWAEEHFRALGLSNVRREGFEFGRGWWIERSSVRMLTPRAAQLTALPISWTPATPGPVAAPVRVAPINSEADFVRWRGQLRGRIVLISSSDAARVPLSATRFTDAALAAMEAEQAPAQPRARNPQTTLDRYDCFPRALDAFLASEGAIASISISRVDGKLVTSDGNRHAVGDTPRLPAFGMAAEDYRRLVRLAEAGEAPTLEIDSRVHFEDADTRAYNIFADIPGSDPTAAFVMAGAHLDSAAAGDGATDDGAGVAMVMEAARILATMPRPRRTIRFALWSGEEQGWLGNIAYMEQHLATRGQAGSGLTPHQRFLTWSDTWPITVRPGWRDLSVYFNLDNGSGRIRGVYADGNAAAVPVFRAWLAPFHDQGAATVALAADGGADHDMLQAIGVPGFQFIQDWNDYGRTHHTTMDTFDHLDPDDMRQASIILASFLWNAANMDRPFPRRALPAPPH